MNNLKKQCINSLFMTKTFDKFSIKLLYCQTHTKTFKFIKVAVSIFFGGSKLARYVRKLALQPWGREFTPSAMSE